MRVCIECRYVCALVRMCVCRYVWSMCACTHVRLYACMCDVCMCVCIFVYIILIGYVLFMYIAMYVFRVYDVFIFLEMESCLKDDKLCRRVWYTG